LKSRVYQYCGLEIDFDVKTNSFAKQLAENPELMALTWISDKPFDLLDNGGAKITVQGFYLITVCFAYYTFYWR
jgi:hypothetical protein